jgi:hypothetical protein
MTILVHISWCMYTEFIRVSKSRIAGPQVMGNFKWTGNCVLKMPWVVCSGFHCSVSIPIVGIIRLRLTHFCLVESHYGFNLHFPNYRTSCLFFRERNLDVKTHQMTQKLTSLVGWTCSPQCCFLALGQKQKHFLIIVRIWGVAVSSQHFSWVLRVVLRTWLSLALVDPLFY